MCIDSVLVPVVIGGGNVAIDVSRTSIRCGSHKVSQVSLETRDIMPALPEEIETAESEGINIIGGWGPKEILTEDGKVTGIVFKKCTSVKDADGRFNPQYPQEGCPIQLPVRQTLSHCCILLS